MNTITTKDGVIYNLDQLVKIIPSRIIDGNNSSHILELGFSNGDKIIVTHMDNDENEKLKYLKLITYLGIYNDERTKY